MTILARESVQATLIPGAYSGESIVVLLSRHAGIGIPRGYPIVSYYAVGRQRQKRKLARLLLMGYPLSEFSEVCVPHH